MKRKKACQGENKSKGKDVAKIAKFQFKSSDNIYMMRCNEEKKRHAEVRIKVRAKTIKG
jgi:hypothetical protein